MEHGETPRRAVVREVEEELGTAIGPLLVTDRWQDSAESNGGPKVLMVFEGQLTSELEGRITVDGGEIVDHRWVPKDRRADVTVPRLANRLQHAITARGAERFVHLKDGAGAQ